MSKTDEDIEIVGVSRRDVDAADLTKAWPVLAGKTSIFTMSLDELGEYQRLAKHLGALPEGVQRFYYLSVPPGAATTIADFLGLAGLSSSHEKILFEKPFGYDYVSALELIERTSRYFDESQLFRIDHFMAKEIAREVIALRSEAEGRHRHWGVSSVSRVEVVAHETLGVEGRGAFYEQTGAIRDVVQGHLMQLLSLVLMEPPKEFEALPTARLRALEQLEPVKPENCVTSQYDGYKEEVGTLDSATETYARLTLYSEDPRWEGVPLILETGKKMPEKRTYIRVVYRDGTEDVFDESKVVYEDNARLKDAYEHVLLAAIGNERAMFTTSDEVLASWRVLTL